LNQKVRGVRREAIEFIVDFAILADINLFHYKQFLTLTCGIGNDSV
jgi:hypothetical protein